MDRFVLGNFLIVLIRVLSGTVLYASGATSAFILTDIPWLSSEAYFEVPDFAFYGVDFSIGEDLYIWVPADLDQLGGQYSHRAVICGKCLV